MKETHRTTPCYQEATSALKLTVEQVGQLGDKLPRKYLWFGAKVLGAKYTIHYKTLALGIYTAAWLLR